MKESKINHPTQNKEKLCEHTKRILASKNIESKYAFQYKVVEQSTNEHGKEILQGKHSITIFLSVVQKMIFLLSPYCNITNEKSLNT